MSAQQASPFGIDIRGLTHRYGAKTALDEVSFSIRRGSFCALLGPNGAGKSTLFALMTRLFVANQGHIKIGGVDLAEQPRRALARMGVVFQQPTLDLDLTVQQNMHYYAALQGISRKRATTRIAETLKRLDMDERASEKVRALNGGHRRRMEIARALLHEPQVLLLDEPTVGLDTRTRQAITQHVHDLVQDTGLTVLWATHLTDEVRADDQLVVLHEGRVVADGVCAVIRGKETLNDAFARLTGQSKARNA
ncbi:MAG: ABC transporter ATP-binding protein [Ahrensia sp.]|nr:ABC transporter ATP-binding protein [Ahrensia sp.]